MKVKVPRLEYLCVAHFASRWTLQPGTATRLAFAPSCAPAFRENVILSAGTCNVFGAPQLYCLGSVTPHLLPPSLYSDILTTVVCRS